MFGGLGTRFEFENMFGVFGNMFGVFGDMIGGLRTCLGFKNMSGGFEDLRTCLERQNLPKTRPESLLTNSLFYI